MSMLARLFLALAVIAYTLPATAEGLDAGIDQAFEINKIDPVGAVDFLAKSLAAAEETRDEDPYLMAEGYFYLGRFQSDAGQLTEAEETLRRSIELIESVPADEPPKLKVDAMELLGKTIGRLGRLDGAVAVFDRVMQMRARVEGRTARTRLFAMEYMAITYEDAGSLRAAEYLWRSALGIGIDTGLSEEDVGFWRKALADNLDRQGRSADADAVRAGAAVEEPEGAILKAIEEAQLLIDAGRITEAHQAYSEMRDRFADTAHDSALYMLILNGLAGTTDEHTAHRDRAAIYEQADLIEASLLGRSALQQGEFLYLAARSRALDGDLGTARKGFDELDRRGVRPDLGAKGRGVAALVAVAAGQTGDCATPVAPADADGILLSAYALDQMLERNGANAGRAAVMECGLTIAGDGASQTARLASLMALVLGLVETARYERAITVAEQTLSLAESMARPPGEIRLILGYMALAHGWTRRFDEALALVGRAEAIEGADDLEKLSLLRIRAITLINATRFLEAEDVLGATLALADSIPPSAGFADDRAAALNDLASVLTRAGRIADALAVTERIVLPESLPEDASASVTIFYLDIRQSLMMLRFAMDRTEEAMAATAAFRKAAIPVVDRLLANPERNVIMAGSIASIMTTAAVALSGLELHDEAGALASKAAQLIAADQSEGVRLLAARNELVQAVAALIRGDAEAALPGFDRALASGQAILPDDSDEMLEIWLGRGMARLGLARLQSADPGEALEDLRQATEIAKVRIARETRFDEAGVQRKLRPSFESLVGSAWLSGALQ